MQMSDIASFSTDQDQGRWFELHDPVEGTPTGIKLRIAGPDSATQRRAELAMVDELAEMADAQGRVSAEHRQAARLGCLARCVLGWELFEDGEPVPFTHDNVLRLLRAGRWVEQQVDGFAGDRAAFRGPAND